MPEDYYGLLPEEAGLLQALLAGEQGLPTAQPVVAVPADGEQRLPTAQPVQAVPVEPDWASMTDWNLGMMSNAPLGVLADTGPAYDPNMVYRFNTGNKIGVPNEQGGFDYRNAAPVVFRPGQQYVMINPLSGEVIGRASSPEEMQKLVDLSSSNKDWQLYQADAQGNFVPGSQLFDRYNAGSVGSMLVEMGALALPAVGGAVLGPVLAGALGSSAAVGTGLGTAIGSAASGITAGKSIEDILKQAAIAGVTAGGLQALAGPPSVTANKVAGLAADLQPQVLDGAITAAQAAQQLTRAGATAADIARFTADVAGTAASTVPTVIGNVANIAANVAPAVSGAASGLLGAVTSAPGTIVQGRPDPADIIRQNPTISISDPLLSQFTPDEVVDASRRVQQEQEQPAATVTATQPAAPTPPPSILPPPATIVTAPTTPAAVEQPTPPVVVPSLPPPGTTVVGQKPETQLPEDDIRTLPGNPTLAPNTSDITLKKDSDLLRDIMRYYSLGSGLLDALGVGKGGGTTTATPYTSTLGVLPTFGRGPFTPFQGDYETYGQGPEWNFFGGK